MKKLFELKLFLPQSRNKTMSRHWGIYRSEKHEYEDLAYYEAISKARNLKAKITKVKLFFTFVFKDKRRRDIDNYFCSYGVKGIIDGISKALGVDDSYHNLQISIQAKQGDEDCLIVECFVE
jgi:Holliday junction resolvase RusA-like endonuclease